MEEKKDSVDSTEKELIRYSPIHALSAVDISKRSNLIAFRAISLDHKPVSITEILKLLPNPGHLKTLGIRTLVGPNVDFELRNDILNLAKFTNLQELHLKLVFHHVCSAGEMRSWFNRNYARMLLGTLASLHNLKTLSIECPYLDLDWTCLPQKDGTISVLPCLVNLELDTGLHNRISSLIGFTTLKTLFYSYYGDYLYVVSELDAIEYLLQRNKRLEYICLKVPHEMSNRVGIANFICQVAQDWQAVTFYVASYYDEYYEDDLLFPSLKLLKLAPNVYFDAYPEEVLEFTKFERVSDEEREKLLLRSLVDMPPFIPQTCSTAPAAPAGSPSSRSIAMW